MYSFSRRATRLYLLCVALLLALPVHAAEPQRCATIVEDTARLACYDAVYGAPAPAPTRAATATAAPSQDAPVGTTATSTAPPPTPVAAGAVAAGAVAAGTAAAAGPATPEDQFGLTPAQVRKKPEPAPEPAAPESIESVLKELTKRRTGELIYTLENGQRWVQVEADSAGKLAPGASVTIRKASMGSYKLVSGDVATRVRRIQ